VRLENVFLRNTPDRVVAGALNDVQFDEFLLEQRRLIGVAPPAPCRMAVQSICFRRAVEEIRGRRSSSIFPGQNRRKTSSTTCRGRRILGENWYPAPRPIRLIPPASHAWTRRLQQDGGPSSIAGRNACLMDQMLSGAFVASTATNVFLIEILSWPRSLPAGDAARQ